MHRAIISHFASRVLAHTVVHKRLLPRVLLLLLLWVLAPQAFAKPFWVYEDVAGDKSLAEVVANADTLFELSGNGAKGFSDSVWWLRIPLHNGQAQAQALSVFFDTPLMRHVDAYSVGSDGIHVQRNGYAVALDDRAVRSFYPVFTEFLASGQSRDLFVRIENDLSTHFDYSVLTAAELQNRLFWRELIHTVLISILGTLLLYHLFLFLFSRERLYAVYLLFVVGGSLALLGDFYVRGVSSGLGLHAGHWIALAGCVSYSAGAHLLGCLFREISSRTWLFALRFVIGFSLAHVPLVLFAPALALQVWVYFSGPLMSAVLVYVISYAWLERHPLAKPVFYGWMVLLLSLVLYMAYLLGLAPATMHEAFGYGVVFQALMFSVVMIYHLRSNAIEIERQQLQLSQAHYQLKAKSDLIANVSHELRTPLNGILGMHQSLGKYVASIKGRELLGAAQTAADTLGMLVNELLDGAKLQANKLRLNPKPVSLDEIILPVETMMRAMAAQKDLSFSVRRGQGENYAVIADCQRLQQVLFNLLSNAVKYTSKGGVDLQIASRHQHGGRIGLVLVVSDTGRGMSEEFQAEMFERFTRADVDDQSAVEAGTGLGLSITRELIHLMDGELRVESVLGQGSRFIVELSLPLTQALPDASVLPLDEGEQVSALANMRLLVVDDNALNRAVIEELLDDTGIALEMVETGAEAVDYVLTHPGLYDAVLMDIQMPEMDGFEASNLIRLVYDAEQLPIIAVSAHADADDQQRFADVGMNASLAKPVNRVQLIETLTAVLHSAKVSPVPEAVSTEVPGQVNALSSQPHPELPNTDLNVSEVFSATELESAYAGDMQAVMRIVDMMVVQIPENTDSLEQAIARSDWPAVASEAHRLKGAARYVYADPMVDACAALEEVAVNKAMAEVLVRFQELRGVAETLKQVLQSYKERVAIKPAKSELPA